MRVKGILLLAIIAALVILFSIIFSDSWIEARLEKIGQALVGAKVEIDNLDFSLVGLSISWDRLQVTNPKNTMQNSIETGRTAFKMNVPALFRKRYVIEEMTLADVRSGTPRDSDGAIAKKGKPSKKKEQPDIFDTVTAKLENEINTLPVMNFDVDAIKRNLNLDSLIVMADLKIVQRVDSAKQDILTTADKWDTFYKELQYEEELKKIREELASINPSNIRNLATITATLEKAKSVQRRITTLHTTITTKQQEVHSDFERIGTYTKVVDTWFNEDYRKIIAKAKLPDLTVTDIGKILFGGTVISQINNYLGYVRTAREYMPKKSSEPKKEKKPRLKGQNIRYPARFNWPTFLVEKMHLSGQTGADFKQPGLLLSGEVTGITSQPWIYGKPTTVDVRALQENKLSGMFAAVLDHTTDTASDSFNIKFVNKSLNNFEIYKTPYLPEKVSKGMADITYILRFEEDNFLTQIDVTARDLQFDFSQLNTSDKFIEITREVINSINVLTLRARVYGQGENVRFSLNSNLDELVSRKLKSMGSEALADAQNKITNRLRSIRDQKLAEANTVLKEKREKIEGVIDNYKKQVDEEKAEIEAKLKLF